MDADDTVWWYRLERLCLGMKRKISQQMTRNDK
jgi:hypothetical protein